VSEKWGKGFPQNPTLSDLRASLFAVLVQDKGFVPFTLTAAEQKRALEGSGDVVLRKAMDVADRMGKKR